MDPAKPASLSAEGVAVLPLDEARKKLDAQGIVLALVRTDEGDGRAPYICTRKRATKS